MIDMNTLSLKQIRYQVSERIAEIQLCSGPANAMSEAMIDEILLALDTAKNDSSVRAVLLTSANPKIFCAGLELDALRKSTNSEANRLLEKLYPKLCDAQFHLGKPSIAVVAGAARGGGMTLAISCDMIIASDSATFGYPEIDVGVPPAIHFTHLPRVIGRHRAFDLLFTGRAFSASEALGLGLISRVFSDDAIQAESKKLAQVLAKKSPEVMRMSRAAFMRANDTGYRQGVSGAVETFCNVLGTDDAQEGLAAFIEKRKPQWTST
jgi:enoyl-CoA hydratase/carnithine racemase